MALNTAAGSAVQDPWRRCPEDESNDDACAVRNIDRALALCLCLERHRTPTTFRHLLQSHVCTYVRCLVLKTADVRVTIQMVSKISSLDRRVWNRRNSGHTRTHARA